MFYFTSVLTGYRIENGFGCHNGWECRKLSKLHFEEFWTMALILPPLLRQLFKFWLTLHFLGWFILKRWDNFYWSLVCFNYSGVDTAHFWRLTRKWFMANKGVITTNKHALDKLFRDGGRNGPVIKCHMMRHPLKFALVIKHFYVAHWLPNEFWSE